MSCKAHWCQEYYLVRPQTKSQNKYDSQGGPIQVECYMKCYHNLLDLSQLSQCTHQQDLEVPLT